MRRAAGWGLALLALANACAVAGLWLATGGPDDVHDLSSGLTAAGRVAGLLGAYLVLVELLLLARIPLLERIAGFERLAAIHRVNGRVALGLLLGHAALITAGYTVGDRIPLLDELDRLITGYPGVITAIAGLALLVAVVVTSAVAVRRRLRYETLALRAPLRVPGGRARLQPPARHGHGLRRRPGARAYWYALYGVTLGTLVVFRLGLPLARSLLVQRLRVERVVEESPGVVSVEIGGVRLERLRARAGQFFSWRFLTRDRWWESHPFSLSAAPDGRRLRITVKGIGDYTARAEGDPARHARDRRGPVRGVHRRGAAAPAGRADRRRRRHHADPRAARGHARRARGTSPSSTARCDGRRDPARRARRAGAAGAASRCTTCSASHDGSAPSACRRWCPTSRRATSTSAGRPR